jgi:hypothetical protein
MLSEWSMRPATRASDADREFAAGLLRVASADGRLSAGDFDRRLRLALGAATVGELVGLVADLQGHPLPPPSMPPPQQPYAFVHVPGPYTSPPRRKNVGLVIGIVAVCAVVVLGLGVGAVGFFSLDSDWMEDDWAAEDLRTEPGACAGPPEDVLLMDCLPEDNPLAWTDLSAARVEQLERLGLPRTLPIIDDADFEDRAWQLAATTRADDPPVTTYTWHLEYLVGDVEFEGPTQPEHVLALYRATVDPGRFGSDPHEIGRDDGATGMRWAGSGQESELTVWVRTEPNGDERVELDVRTEVRPAVARPDVLGALAADLQRQPVATAPAMTYLRSKVSQVADRLDTCLVEQVWTATPAQFAAVRGKVGQGVTATHEDGELTFATTTRCTAFNL